MRHSTQRSPVESFAAKIDLISDCNDMSSQHNGLCLTQAVQYRMVAVDEFVKIVNIPNTKVGTGQDIISVQVFVVL